MLFCGVDFHSNNCFVVSSDDDDRILYSKRLPNNFAEICSALSPYQSELFGIVVESIYNWYWLVDGLIDASYSFHLANITSIKQYDALKHRGDESDARHLARKRTQLMQQRNVQILSIETCLARQTGGWITSNDVEQLIDAAIDNLSIGAVKAIGMKANVAVLQALQTQIDGIEKALAVHCRSNPGYRLLRTVSGIGPILASVILLETGSIERFADVGNYASYCRCVGSIHVSNGKKKGEGNTKNGNRYLAWAYVKAANLAIRYCEPVRKFYQRKKAKWSGIVAIKAVALKLARACFHMLKTGEQFSIERCFT